MNWIENWTGENDAMVVADNSPFSNWSSWGASQRDLYILNHEGLEVFHENITSGFNENEIYNLISSLVEDISISIQGDVNGDGTLNVLDVVLLVNIILNP